MSQLDLFAGERSRSFGPVSYGAVRDLVTARHYSGRMPRGSNLTLGWTIRGRLYAAASFGNGVNPHQATFLARITGLPVTKANHVELKRLVREEPAAAGLPLSAFLKLCHQHLRTQGVRYVVAFSDPDQGHNGGVYIAANYFRAGQTQAERHAIDPDGRRVHRRLAYRTAQRRGVTIAQARHDLGLTPVVTTPRDRWFYPLFRNDRRKLHAIRHQVAAVRVGRTSQARR